MADPIADAAAEREERWKNHPGRRPLALINPDHIGLRGEERYALEFGTRVDLKVKHGDGGRDFVLDTIYGKFKVDVKTFTLHKGLLVEVSKLRLRTIYVMGGYRFETDDAVLLGWQWSAVVARSEIIDLKRGILNYFIERSKLRPMIELHAVRRLSSGQTGVNQTGLVPSSSS